MPNNCHLSQEDLTNLNTACFVAAEVYDEHVKEFAGLIASSAAERNPEAAAKRVGYKRLADQFEKQARDIRALAARLGEVEAD